MTKNKSVTRGYDADVSADESDEDFEPRPSKRTRPDADVRPPAREQQSTAPGNRNTETDTEAESVRESAAESVRESPDESETLGSHETSEYESPHLSQSLGSRDTSPDGAR